MLRRSVICISSASKYCKLIDVLSLGKGPTSNPVMASSRTDCNSALTATGNTDVYVNRSNSFKIPCRAPILKGVGFEIAAGAVFENKINKSFKRSNSLNGIEISIKSPFDNFNLLPLTGKERSRRSRFFSWTHYSPQPIL